MMFNEETNFSRSLEKLLVKSSYIVSNFICTGNKPIKKKY